VPSNWATLNGKPVGEARGSVNTTPEQSSPARGVSSSGQAACRIQQRKQRGSTWIPRRALLDGFAQFSRS